MTAKWLAAIALGGISIAGAGAIYLSQGEDFRTRGAAVAPGQAPGGGSGCGDTKAADGPNCDHETR